MTPHTNKSVDIPLDGKNLIITGGNGSGKTSFLRDAYEKYVSKIAVFEQQLEKQAREKTQYHIDSIKASIKRYQADIKKLEREIRLTISDHMHFSSKHDARQAVVLYFEDKRLANIAEAKTLQGLQTAIEESYDMAHEQHMGYKLEQHLLNLRSRHSFAITEDENPALAASIDVWFENFGKNLKRLFEDNSTRLLFDSNISKFSIKQDDKPP